MKKVFYSLILSLLFVSCSSDENEIDDSLNTDKYNTVKVIITRNSNDLSKFFGGTSLWISSDELNTQYDEKDFDAIEKDDADNLILGKINEPLASNQILIIKQNKIKVQVMDIPQLNDDVEAEDEEKYNLKTTIEIYVNDKVVKVQEFTFDPNAENLNLITYSK